MKNTKQKKPQKIKMSSAAVVIRLGISYKFSAQHTIHMKCHALFSLKNITIKKKKKKKKIKMLSAAVVNSPLRVNLGTSPIIIQIIMSRIL